MTNHHQPAQHYRSIQLVLYLTQRSLRRRLVCLNAPADELAARLVAAASWRRAPADSSALCLLPVWAVQCLAVGDLVGTLAAAVGVFAGTNIDDIIVLTVLFLSARASGKPHPWQIWVGQYVGVAALVAASAVAALGLTLIPDQWVGLLGLVPFGLGVRGLIGAIRSRSDEELPTPAVAAGLASVVGVTVANGADNISVYTPMFRTIGVTASLVTVAVFAVGVAVWCLAGSWLGSHRRVVDVVERFGHWIVPGVFMLIGAVIVLKSGVLARLI
ncbi:cadmium resistance transporter [Micromonospora yasonensis]|uniref:cadmium resistance transporter n=1 Tax=Micromonospora yasonensis TaxID=1128667 RepID=UPI00223299E9|nr:cadmium resistance transporter [Micromonospora yasonensis]MCW3838500.1 cadmium resistance transporter [Micromonospora yasonensis]